MELLHNSISRYSYGTSNWLIGLSILTFVILAPLYLLRRNKHTQPAADDVATHDWITTQKLQPKLLVCSHLADFDNRDNSPQRTLDNIIAQCDQSCGSFLETHTLSDSNEGANEKHQPFQGTNSMLQNCIVDSSISVLGTTAIEEVEVKAILSTQMDARAYVDNMGQRFDEISESQAQAGNEVNLISPETQPSKLPNGNTSTSSTSRSSASINKTKPKAEHIEQQRQTYTPTYKSRCEFWPHCTNKSCKYYHPFTDCRNASQCQFGRKCIFLHPKDYTDYRQRKQKGNTWIKRNKAHRKQGNQQECPPNS